VSEFMKSVVAEVMKPYQKPKENPLFGGGSGYQETKAPPKTAVKSIQGIAGINRPNYQRDKVHKRLATSGEATTKVVNQTSKLDSPPKKVSVSTVSKDFVAGPMASLQTMSLVQGNRSVNSYQRTAATSMKKRVNEESKLIGQTKEGVKAWVFNNLHPNLGTSLQRSLKSDSIGVITAETCSVGQLFLINDLMREFATIKYFLTWDKESKQKFVLELYGQDSESLTKVVKSLFQKLTQKSHKDTHVYKSMSPSPWLTKQLELQSPVNGVAVLAGIDYYTSILLLDRFLKKSGETKFSYMIEKSYLLLHGNYELVSQISEELQKEVDRIR
jgi:hypothetical protein